MGAELALCLCAAALAIAAMAMLAGGETALKAAGARLNSIEASGKPGAARLVALIGPRERLAGAVLLGKILALVTASGFVALVATHRYGDTGLLVALAGLALAVVLFGEIVPRTLASAHPERWALALVGPMAATVAVLGPVAMGLRRAVRFLLKPFGVSLARNRDILSAHEELRGAVDLLHREGIVVKADRDMLGGLLDLRELEVADVMVHRTKMRTINADLDPQEIVREVLASPYTRMPLWRGQADNILGVLHAKDLLRALDAAGGDASRLKVDDLALEAWFTPVTTLLPDQLRNFLAKKLHFALAVDEYGEVMGLVTLEDILEEIVGDIRDEHDIAVQGVRPQKDGSLHLDGGVPIRDLNRVMDWKLPDDNATTIAGLVIHEAQSIPDANQLFTFHGLRIRVVRKRRNRITVLKVTPLKPGRPGAERGG